MAIHILGNGPSIQFFDRDVWPETDMFVGCNFSDPSFRVHYTSVIDIAAIKHVVKGRVPSAPLLLSTRAAEEADKIDEEWRERTVGIEEIVDLPRDRTISRNLSMNSAQHATVYTLRNYPDHSEVHLWGIDSFWSTDLESRTDAVVRPNQRTPRVKPKITRQWNGYWHKILSDHSKIHTFVIHKPTNKIMDERLMNYSNVRIAEACHTRTTTTSIK